jgi:quercetin dioxygenase-like cupin family protein
MEHLTVISGTMEVEVDGVSKKLKTGGTARYQADKAHAIQNSGKSEAKALLVVIHR